MRGSHSFLLSQSDCSLRLELALVQVQRSCCPESAHGCAGCKPALATLMCSPVCGEVFLQELRHLAAEASAKGLPTFVVQDAGEGGRPHTARIPPVPRQPRQPSRCMRTPCCCVPGRSFLTSPPPGTPTASEQAARRWHLALALCWP